MPFPFPAEVIAGLCAAKALEVVRSLLIKATLTLWLWLPVVHLVQTKMTHGMVTSPGSLSGFFPFVHCPFLDIHCWTTVQPQ